jgi:hypothetical protein
MKITALLTALAVLLAAGCSSVSVSTDFDSKADFSKYKTFGWLKEKESNGVNDVSGEMHEYIKKAVDQQLTAKGLMKATVNNDLSVVYHAGNKKELEEEEYGYGGWWGAGGGVTIEYEKGSLVVDLVDRRENKLVWRGTAKAVLSENPSDAEREATIDEAVEKMFKKFPPSQ